MIVLAELLAYLLYLFYGLVFFAMGASITSKVTRASTLAIAPCLWLFSLFALIHALHEWSELYMVLTRASMGRDLLLVIKTWKLLPVFLSFFILLIFGIRLLGVVFPAHRRRLLLLPAALLLLSVWAVFGGEVEYTRRFLQRSDLLLRNLIGFPAAALAGCGFIFYSKTVRHLSDRGARNFTGAGICLVLYGVFAGLVPSRTFLWPMGIQVEVFRAIAAAGVLHFIMNALHVFDLERQGQIAESLQRFAQSEKLNSLGKLAAGIAHEINNPLANVSLNVEMLKKSLAAAAGGEAHAKRFAAIERNLDRASRIARELLAFSRQEEKEEAAVPLDLNEVLGDILTLLGPRRHDYRFELALNPLPTVRGLSWKIEEVFLNILINAMDATVAGGEIAIATRAEKNAAIVEITDSGIGIPPEHFHSIFDPFFTTKEVGQGTGLGLSICFGIMESHGGRIEVSSKPGMGTTMTLFFPAGGCNDA